MQTTVPAVDVKLAAEGVVFEVESLYAALAGLTDRRHARGIRHTLVHVLVYLLLAKLAGQDRLSGIADWVKYRQETLAQLLGLSRPRAPSLNTYRRVLGQYIDIEEFERVVRDFFAALPGASTSRERALDGKTLRGTIVTGQMQGRHLLAVFLPSEGWVELQVEVGSHENEISAAPGVLKSLDLQGKVVTGDAIFAQRDLSQQIVEASGDYVWTVKDNQPTLRQDLEVAFQSEPTSKGFSPTPKAIRSARTIEKGHGREEQRILRVTADLNGYLDWPGVQQVFQLERHIRRTGDGHVSHEVVYGISSLTAAEASPEQLLAFNRGHWAIENGLHYRRDETLREDWCHLKCGNAPWAMAVINNLIIGLVLHLKRKNLPATRRYFDSHPQEAQWLVLRRLS